MRFAAALLLLALVALCRADWWSSCATGPTHFTISQLGLSPNPPIIGQNVTITISGTLDETVTDGTGELIVQYYYIWWHQVLDQTKDICQIDPSVKCPIAKNTYNLKLSHDIPTEINGVKVPAGQYKGSLNLKDQNSAQIACIDFNFNLDD